MQQNAHIPFVVETNPSRISQIMKTHLIVEAIVDVENTGQDHESNFFSNLQTSAKNLLFLILLINWGITFQAKKIEV